MSATPSLAEALARALEAYDELTELGETLDDEWTYVNDLSTSWRDRLGELLAERGSERLAAPSAVALEVAATEARAITDPHRAIDWLSTYPQVVLLALGERP
jgi:hypothetical protein